MKPKNMMLSAFVSGWMTHSGLTVARQDWLGLELYIQRVREGWVDLHWLVGASVALIAWAFYAYLSAKLPKD